MNRCTFVGFLCHFLSFPLFLVASLLLGHFASCRFCMPSLMVAFEATEEPGGMCLNRREETEMLVAKSKATRVRIRHTVRRGL